MKETLDEQSRQALIQYRIERVDETMEEVRILADSSHFNAAVNRLYYACFYAVQALLLKHHIAAGTHAGTDAPMALMRLQTCLITLALQLPSDTWESLIVK